MRYTVVNTLTASMIKDSKLMFGSSLHTFAEVNIRNSDGEERNRDRNPEDVLHRCSIQTNPGERQRLPECLYWNSLAIKPA